MFTKTPKSLKRFLVTVEVTIDPTQFDSPADWDWDTLLDVGAGTAATLVACVEMNENITHIEDPEKCRTSA